MASHWPGQLTKKLDANMQLNEQHKKDASHGGFLYSQSNFPDGWSERVSLDLAQGHVHRGHLESS